MNSDSCFILFQPEISFLLRDIGHDTPETNWSKPESIRDRIRCNFKKQNMMYEIPDSIYYPTSHHIVKPAALGDSVVEWWAEKGVHSEDDGDGERKKEQ